MPENVTGIEIFDHPSLLENILPFEVLVLFASNAQEEVYCVETWPLGDVDKEKVMETVDDETSARHNTGQVAHTFILKRMTFQEAVAVGILPGLDGISQSEEGSDGKFSTTWFRI